MAIQGSNGGRKTGKDLGRETALGEGRQSLKADRQVLRGNRKVFEGREHKGRQAEVGKG